MKRIFRPITSTAIALIGGTLPACSMGSHSEPIDVGQIVSEMQSPQTRFSGVIPQFVQPLPLPSTSGAGIRAVFGNRPLTLRMCEFWANVLPTGTFEPGTQPKTRVWGYVPGETCPPNGPNDPALDTYIGPAVVNDRNDLMPKHDWKHDWWLKRPSRRSGSTDVTWLNELGKGRTTQVLAYRYSTDQTLHWADPLHKEANDCAALALGGAVPAFGSQCAQNYDGPIPAVVHLHGGEVPAEIDGGPEAWFTSDAAFKGPAYYTFEGKDVDDDACDEHDYDYDRRSRHRPRHGSALYKYPNTQEAAPIWFHDHTFGTTRLNVHAGLAGAYFIEDPTVMPKGTSTTSGTPGTCRHDCLPANLPPLANAVPLVMQDRIFDTNGQLFFPADTAGGEDFRINPQHPYWVPEFVGSAILVNGKAWPFVQLEAKRQQFMILNGSNARPYELSIPDGPPMYVIATDGGYLDEPAEITAANPLLVMPGERYEVIVDFGNFANRNLVLRNTGRTPFPNGDSPVGTPLEQIVEFRIGSPPSGGDSSYDPASVPVVPLRTGDNAIVRLADPVTGTLAPGVSVKKTRQLTLNEVIQAPSIATDPVTGVPNTSYPGGPFQVLVNNTTYEGTNYQGEPRNDFTPITIGPRDERITKYVSELPREGETELWEIVNLTADAHPIHLHLVQFQLVNRQDIDVAAYTTVYNAAFGGSFIPGFGPPLNYRPSAASGGKFGGNPDVTPFLSTEPGAKRPPEPYEAGWKDTVVVPPGAVTRIAVRWAPTDIPTSASRKSLYYPFDPTNDRGYVWHCHIIDHEDNDMMRPYNVDLNLLAPRPTKRPLVRGKQY